MEMKSVEVYKKIDVFMDKYAVLSYGHERPDGKLGEALDYRSDFE